MLALCVGLLAGSAILPRSTHGQQFEGAEGRSGRYALVTGVPGSTTRSQTVYILDDLNQFLYAFEYRSKSEKFEYRSVIDLRLVANKFLKDRARHEQKKR